MAYVSGSASTYAALLTAIQNALTANGWTLTSGILSKSGTHVKIAIINPFTTGSQAGLSVAVGNSSSAGALTGSLSAIGVRVGPFGTTAASGDIVFPCTYEIFINTSPDEVYVVINYSTDMYQWFGFGKSPASGNTGTGNWLSGSFSCPASGTNGNPVSPLSGGQSFYVGKNGISGTGSATASAGLFASSGENTSTGAAVSNDSIMHCDLSLDNGWASGLTSNFVPRAYYAVCKLMSYSPNAWNSQATLFNITPSVAVASNKRVIYGQIAHARYIKMNFIAPGTVITLGSDKWKIFPWFRKGTVELDGYGANTGFYGHAFRYDGP